MNTVTAQHRTMDDTDLRLAQALRAWLDLGQEAESVSVPLGGGLFDIVITAGGTPGHAAVAAMDEIQLGTCGPVVEIPEASLLYWLVPPGTCGQWAHHNFGLCLGAPLTLELPKLRRTRPPGRHWLRPCRSDRLVPPLQLRRVLDESRPGPAPYDAVGALFGLP
ncbi:hypothetical protein OHS70_38585 (plasmid) [Streptomyces sp. NBC_00390]|uniref:hypothetical protein n=1 Tax=Streptomyces sp. NBC_00390 TaxID=2975736 RepID=UPI002E1E21D5